MLDLALLFLLVSVSADECPTSGFYDNCAAGCTALECVFCSQYCTGYDAAGRSREPAVISFCKSGFTGSTCGLRCPENCVQGGSKCTIKGYCPGYSDKENLDPELAGHCPVGKYGWKCDTTCRSTMNCAQRGCTSRGLCSREYLWGDLGITDDTQRRMDPYLPAKHCVSQFYGDDCTSPCPTTCLLWKSKGCSEDGYCLGYQRKSQDPATCQPGYYGRRCNVPCSKNSHCARIGCTPRDGFCYDWEKYEGGVAHHCKPGWYGLRCSSKCPPCAANAKQVCTDRGECCQDDEDLVPSFSIAPLRPTMADVKFLWPKVKILWDRFVAVGVDITLAFKTTLNLNIEALWTHCDFDQSRVKQTWSYTKTWKKTFTKKLPGLDKFLSKLFVAVTTALGTGGFGQAVVISGYAVYNAYKFYRDYIEPFYEEIKSFIVGVSAALDVHDLFVNPNPRRASNTGRRRLFADSPPTNAPPTNAPPTNAPPTNAPPTSPLTRPPSQPPSACIASQPGVGTGSHSLLMATAASWCDCVGLVKLYQPSANGATYLPVARQCFAVFSMSASVGSSLSYVSGSWAVAPTNSAISPTAAAQAPTPPSAPTNAPATTPTTPVSPPTSAATGWNVSVVDIALPSHNTTRDLGVEGYNMTSSDDLDNSTDSGDETSRRNCYFPGFSEVAATFTSPRCYCGSDAPANATCSDILSVDPKYLDEPLDPKWKDGVCHPEVCPPRPEQGSAGTTANIELVSSVTYDRFSHSDAVALWDQVLSTGVDAQTKILAIVTNPNAPGVVVVQVYSPLAEDSRKLTLAELRKKGVPIQAVTTQPGLSDLPTAPKSAPPAVSQGRIGAKVSMCSCWAVYMSAAYCAVFGALG